MDSSTLADLVRTREYPAVSVLIPTHRHAPDNQQDPIRLRNLLTEVRRRLRTDDLVSGDVVADVVRGLERAADSVDLEHAQEGLALFAAPGGEYHAFLLPDQVEEKVAVDETFLTRDVVAALGHTLRYWVLVLSEKPTRLWSGEGDRLVEVTAEGFPIRREPNEREVERPGKYPGRPRRRNGEWHRQFHRDVDRALGAVLVAEPRPVILVGTKRNLTAFEETTSYGAVVIGTVEGAHENASPHELAGLVRPVLDAERERRRGMAMSELASARGDGRYAAGLDEVWQLARQGRVAHLVVENGYRTRARVREDRLVTTGPEDLGSGGVEVEDAVDDVIEIVLGHGGEVTFVPDDVLADRDRIAMVTRF